MSRLVDLLPPRSTDLELAVVEVMDSRSRVRERIARVIGARHDEMIDPALLPWLLRDWGLEEAAAFVEDWQLLYREGKAWQRERGTLAALDRSLAWLDQAGASIEEIMPGSPRWAEFQIALPRAPERLAPLGNIIGLARLSAGSRSILDRVHAGFDVRAARPDFTILDAGLLDFDSGVRLQKDWPILSFGREQKSTANADDHRTVLQFDLARRDVGFARYVDDLMLDWSVPDNQRASVFRPFDAGLVDNFELESGARRDQFFDTHRLIKAGIILDRQWPVESLNAVFPGCDLVPTGRHWLADGFRLDADTFYLRKVAVEAIVEAVSRGTANLLGAMTLAGAVPILASTVNLRVRRGHEADETRLDATASAPVPELQTFSHVIGQAEHPIAPEDLALVPHEIYRAGIRFDHGPAAESLQSVFTGGDPRPYGRPWIADGFRTDQDTFWHRSTPVREIVAARVASEPVLPQPSALAVTHVSLGVSALVVSRIVDETATLLTSFEISTASYDGQSWVDLVPPDGATWENLHVIIGTSLNGDPDR